MWKWSAPEDGSQLSALQLRTVVFRQMELAPCIFCEQNTIKTVHHSWQCRSTLQTLDACDKSEV